MRTWKKILERALAVLSEADEGEVISWVEYDALMAAVIAEATARRKVAADQFEAKMKGRLRQRETLDQQERDRLAARRARLMRACAQQGGQQAPEEDERSTANIRAAILAARKQEGK